MTDVDRLRTELVERVLGATGTAPISLRQHAFSDTGLDGPAAALVAKVAGSSFDVTDADADVEAVRWTGLTEDETFEVMVCAAVGQAARQYTAALAALARVTGADRP